MERAADSVDFLGGGGEMGERVRAMDWSSSPLGPISSWPQSLRTAVSIVLNARYPMFVFWGPSLVQIYNDDFRPIAGTKHPWALGRTAREVWPEVWDTVGPMIDGVVERGESTWAEDMMMFLERHGFTEEVYFTFSYSAARDESGGVGGMFCVCTETTEKILGTRRLRTLHALAARPAEARAVDAACRLSAEVLADATSDIPFAAIYALERDDRLRRKASCGILPGDMFAPGVVHPEDDSGWPFADVLERCEPQIVALSSRFVDVPPGTWPEPPNTALVLPLIAPGTSRPAGAIVLGVSPRLQLDDRLREFLELVAKHVATSMANARASEDERARTEALAELDRAKTTFFSNVSHEFRTPLALMLAPLDDLLGAHPSKLDPDTQETLRLVRKNAQRLLKLVNTLLDFSRIEADRVEATYTPVDLGALTRELASGFRAAIERAELTYRVDTPQLDAATYVDREMWEKIVLNLISNAFKFTFEGEIDVSLRAEGDKAVLRVRDTGAGIPESELPNLFRRFHRVEGARGRTQEGSGIGLALVNELVRLHGGRVDVESEEDRGTVFIVSLPLGKAHLSEDRIDETRTDAATAVRSETYVEEAVRWLPDPARDLPVLTDDGQARTSRSDGPATRVRRVLLADDNADMRGYVARLLRQRYHVTAVTDGAEALESALEHPPDLVLSDVMMPELDGIELTRALRRDPRTAAIPVLLLSARADETGRLDGIAAGADGYLSKPFSARELVARVDGSIALAEARQAVTAALRSSEARFRHLADNAPVMVWVTEPDGVCTFLGRSWYEFTGQRPEDSLGFGWLDAVHPDDRESSAEIFARANAQRRPFRIEYRLRHRDGDYRWAIDAAAPRLDDDGTFLGYIGSVIDISDRKEAEEALRDADRRKDEFLATLAHELRNPLAPIRTGIDLLEATTDDERAARPLGVMKRQLDHLVRLVDDLLDVSRISRGKIELRRAPFDLRRAVQSAIEATQPHTQRHGHRSTVDLPAAPIYVDGDAARLAQVFTNLLDNAATYTNQGGHIQVRMRVDGDDVVTEIQDDGIGLPQEQADTAFELFSQLDGRPDRPRKGLGIGLSLVKRLVTMHEGTVGAHSAGPGHGTTFTVRLPRHEAAPAAPVEEDAPLESAPRRVLVVDDNVDAASALAELLRVMGHDVRTAVGGAAGIAAADEHVPEILFIDLGMPEVDGYTVCRRLHERAWANSALFVALTGWSQEQVAGKTREAGFDEHVVKPVDVARVRSLVASRPAG